MSALGQKQTLGNVAPMSAIPPKADIPGLSPVQRRSCISSGCGDQMIGRPWLVARPIRMASRSATRDTLVRCQPLIWQNPTPEQTRASRLPVEISQLSRESFDVTKASSAKWSRNTRGGIRREYPHIKSQVICSQFRAAQPLGRNEGACSCDTGLNLATFHRKRPHAVLALSPIYSLTSCRTYSRAAFPGPILTPAISTCRQLTDGWIREILICSESARRWERGTLELVSGHSDNQAGKRLVRPLSTGSVFTLGCSGRFSITWSIRPNSLAISAVRNISRSKASSIFFSGWPVCLT
jgi:hypothetical protein